MREREREREREERRGEERKGEERRREERREEERRERRGEEREEEENFILLYILHNSTIYILYSYYRFLFRVLEYNNKSYYTICCHIIL